MAGWHGDWQWAQQEAWWEYCSQLDALTTAVRDLETQVGAMQSRLSELELEHSRTPRGDDASVQRQEARDGSMPCAWHADEESV